MSAEKMQAILVREFGDASVLNLETITVPPISEATDVLVRVEAVGINPVETYIRAGKMEEAMPALPYTPGQDGAGIVVAIGEAVTKVKVGDRVFIAGSKSGTYAQYSVSDETQVYPLPAPITFEQGAALHIPYKTAFISLSRAHARPGQTLFVHGGSGGVGVASIQFARAMGLKVIASAGTPEGLAFVKELGAHYAVNHREDGYIQQVLDYTGGQGPDIILEMAADKNLANDMQMINPHGVIVVIGCRGPNEIDARQLMAKNATIKGVLLLVLSTEERIETFAAIVSGLENGTLRPVIAKSYPLLNASQAHVDIMDHSLGSHGKLILLPWQ